MKKELGIASCGLACCLCSENENCKGCYADDCLGKDWCEVRKCVFNKGISHCYECNEAEICKKGVLFKTKPHGFTVFAKKYGEKYLIECLEKNENNGVIYHRSGIKGDYDECKNLEELFKLVKSGKVIEYGKV